MRYHSETMKIAAICLTLLVGSCGAVDAVPNAIAVPEATSCTLDGQQITGVDCYAAASHAGIGIGAVFGMALQLPSSVYYFQASTIASGASTFPAPNNAMAWTLNVGMASETTCHGIGSATWTDDGTTFCVTTTAVCETTTPTTHVACVPSSLLR